MYVRPTASAFTDEDTARYWPYPHPRIERGSVETLPMTEADKEAAKTAPRHRLGFEPPKKRRTDGA